MISGFWLQRGNALTGEAALQNTEKRPQNQTDKHNLHSEARELIKYIFVSFFLFCFEYIFMHVCAQVYEFHFQAVLKLFIFFDPFRNKDVGRKAQLQKQ